MMSVEENVTLISIRSLKKKFGFYIDPKGEQEQLQKMTDFMAIKYANPKAKDLISERRQSAEGAAGTRPAAGQQSLHHAGADPRYRRRG